MAQLKEKLRLTRPFNQNFVVALILFCLPGIYVALTGLGAGGGRPSSAQVANNINAINYGVFSVMSLIVGSVLNRLKPKFCLMLGAVGYPIFVGGLWHYDRSGNDGYAYFGGTILGFSAAFLWTTAAYVQFSYPEEQNKAMYISIQWMTRAVGATIGALIAFGANFSQTKAVGVSTAVYAVFIVIQSCALFIAFFFVVDPKNVLRDDGTHIAIFKRPGILQELKGMGRAAIDSRYLILAIPMFACEMALGMMSSVSSSFFNLRTRALNNIAFQVIQIFAPWILTLILDSEKIKSRVTRGIIAIGIMGTVSVSACAGLIGWLHTYKVDDLANSPGTDWTSASFGSFFVLYTMFGSIYSGYQLVTEYTLSSTTNDPAQLSKVAGLFKFYSSLGMFVSFLMSGQRVAFLVQAITQLCLYAAGIVCIVYILSRKVHDSNYFLESNVIVPQKYEEKARQEGKITETEIEMEHAKQDRAVGDAAFAGDAKRVAEGDNIDKA